MQARTAALSLFLVGLLGCSAKSVDRGSAQGDEPASKKPAEPRTGGAENRLRVTYSIAIDQVVDDRTVQVKRDLEAKLEAASPKPLAGKVTRLADVRGGLAIILENPDELQRLDVAFFSVYDEWIAEIDCPEAHRARSVCVRLKPEYVGQLEKAALAQAIRTVRERIDARGVPEPTVMGSGKQLIVELPGLDEVEMARVKSLIARTARLEFKKVVHDSEYMKKLFKHADTAPAATSSAIEAEVDIWRHDASGKQFMDYYLMARDEEVWIPIAEAKARGCFNHNKRVVEGEIACRVTGRQRIIDYVAALAAKRPEFAPAKGHELSFEYVQPPKAAANPTPYWRSYYLAEPAELDGTAVEAANVVWNPTTNAPEVLLSFNRAGGQRFGDMTARDVGHRLAILLDARVTSAPIIQGAIRGGRSTITMGGSDPMGMQREAEDLVTVLRTGALPAPLVEESSELIGDLPGRTVPPRAR